MRLTIALAALAALAGAYDAAASTPPALDIAAGSSARHTCAIAPDGTLLCWGDNAAGQLGDGTTLDRPAPVEVPALAGVVDATAGYAHSCAAVDTGEVFCWGDNLSGQLGDGSTADRLAPVAVAGLSDATAVAAGFSHTCALRSTGGVVCWGNNLHGQIGNGATGGEDELTPVAVHGLGAGVTAIAIGDWHGCALLSTGDVRCWGENLHGQLGNGVSGVNLQATPVAVALDGPAVQIAAGGRHTCAVLDGGDVRCWGRNTAGQLGDGQACGSICPSPVAVPAAAAEAVEAGYDHTCTIDAAAAVACWGANASGQLGDGTATARNQPVPVDLEASSGLAPGDAHTCAIALDGSVRCWGANGDGQAGTGVASASEPAPAPVEGLAGKAVGGLASLPAMMPEGPASIPWVAALAGAMGLVILLGVWYALAHPRR